MDSESSNSNNIWFNWYIIGVRLADGGTANSIYSWLDSKQHGWASMEDSGSNNWFSNSFTDSK